MQYIQYSSNDISEMGFQSIHFIGNRYLNILKMTSDAIQQKRGIKFRLQDIPLNDAMTFETLSNGKTDMVWWLGSEQATNSVLKNKPQSIKALADTLHCFMPRWLIGGYI